MIFKKNIILFAGLALIASLAWPVVSSAKIQNKFKAVSTANAAENEENNDSSAGKKLQIASCDRFLEVASRVKERIAERESNIAQRRTEREARFTERFAFWDKMRAERRAFWDKRRQEQFAKMEARAKTTEQKKAILAFEKEINAAVSARRSAVDDAISRFRKGIKSAIDARKSAITEAISDFKEAIDDAVEKAENDCQNGTALASVRQVLRTSFQNARVKLQTDKQSIEKLGPNVQTLVATRQKAVQKAVEDFRAAVEKARNNLKNALGKDIDLDGLSETGE